MIETANQNREQLKKKLLPIMDTMDLLNGKWRVIIMTTLYISGKMRFNEIKRIIPTITSRMLSKELKYLEEHQIVSRSTKNTVPITVEYELTKYGMSLDKVFIAITDWGTKHRHKMMKE